MASGDVEQADHAARSRAVGFGVGVGDGLAGGAPGRDGGLDRAALEACQGDQGRELVGVHVPVHQRDGLVGIGVGEALGDHVGRGDLAKGKLVKPATRDLGPAVKALAFAHVVGATAGELGGAAGRQQALDGKAHLRVAVAKAQPGTAARTAEGLPVEADRAPARSRQQHGRDTSHPSGLELDRALGPRVRKQDRDGWVLGTERVDELAVHASRSLSAPARPINACGDRLGLAMGCRTKAGSCSVSPAPPPRDRKLAGSGRGASRLHVRRSWHRSRPLQRAPSTKPKGQREGKRKP